MVRSGSYTFSHWAAHPGENSIAGAQALEVEHDEASTGPKAANLTGKAGGRWRGKLRINVVVSY